MDKLEQRILALFARPDYQPLKRHELAGVLELQQEERTGLRRALRRLEEAGRVVRLRKNRLAAAVPVAVREGTLRVHRKGHGMVVASDNGEEFVVPVDRMGGLLADDLVRFEVLPPSSGQRMHGPRAARQVRVIEVVRRAPRRVVGLLMQAAAYDYVIPDRAEPPGNIRVRGYAPEVEIRQSRRKVLVEIDMPTDPPGDMLTGLVLEDLGHEEEVGVDVLSIVRRKGIATAHAPAASRAAREIIPLEGAQAPGRRDLRERLIVTIDPEDAKDYDDAVSLEWLDNGRLRLGVHIADVAHYVEQGGAIDADARLRGNSVYLVDRVVPMLPAWLTTAVCSLVPGEDRLTHSIDITLSPEGEVESFVSFPSLICSSARLSYDEVQAFIENPERANWSPALQAMLQRMHELARCLRARREQAGSIAFNLPEVTCLLDERGHPVKIRKRTEFEAYQLIEEFMLLANRLIASRLHEAAFPALYRVHPDPDREQWKRMGAELNALGIARAPTNRAEIKRFMESLHGKPVEQTAATMILRNFNQASYAAAQAPHFGLAFDCYTHFTSPIRRYPDLVVHRQLKAFEQGLSSPHTAEELREIALQCHATERAALEAERESLTLKRVEYYAGRLREGRTGPYKGMVVAVLPIGLIVELFESLQGGLLPYTALGNDRYVVNDARTRATGRRHKQVYALGMCMEVMLARVDERNSRLDFRLVSAADDARSRRAPTQRKPRRGRRRGKRE